MWGVGQRGSRWRRRGMEAQEGVNWPQKADTLSEQLKIGLFTLFVDLF